MSVQADGCRIKCDAPGCEASAHLPVGLRSTLHDRSTGLNAICGWVFELSDGVSRHYCPTCGHAMLGQPDRPVPKIKTSATVPARS